MQQYRMITVSVGSGRFVYERIGGQLPKLIQIILIF